MSAKNRPLRAATIHELSKIVEIAFYRRKHEVHINTFPHYQTTIVDDDDHQYRMYFVGLFSEKPDAAPILLLHGWPGTLLF